MIQSVQEQEYVFASNTDNLKFSTTDLRTRSASCQFPGWLNHNDGSATFEILNGGIYEVKFNANVTSGTAGQVALALFGDGVQIIGAEADTTIATAGEYENISINKTIRVCGRSSATLSIQSVPNVVYDDTTTETQIPIVKNANIIITRIA